MNHREWTFANDNARTYRGEETKRTRRLLSPKGNRSAAMERKVYSRLAEIPAGSAPDEVVEGCLVLEGGAFRGLYTQGFLDAMMQNGLNMRCTVGVSAGALSGLNYVAGQIGRSARINLGYRHDGRYVGTRAFLHSRSVLDIGFLTEDRGVLEPLDEERFYRDDQRFVAVATNCLTGEPAYFEKGVCDDILLAVRASATVWTAAGASSTSPAASLKRILPPVRASAAQKPL